MKINTTLFLSKLILSFLLLTATLLVISCGSDDNYYVKQPPAEGAISNLKLVTTKGSVNYINLKNKNLVTSNEHWDFSMSKTYATTINANTEKSGAVNYIDKAYDDVTTADVLAAFNATKEDFLEKFVNISNFGLHKFPQMGNKEGWVEYTGEPDHLTKPLVNRTILLLTTDTQTNTKKLYKISIISLYKDANQNPQGDDAKKDIHLNCKFKELESPF